MTDSANTQTDRHGRVWTQGTGRNAWRWTTACRDCGQQTEHVSGQCVVCAVAAANR